MPGSEATRLECGCGKAMLFGFQLKADGVELPGEHFEEAHLFHADGTPVCSVPEPPAVAPASIWPQEFEINYVPGRVGAVSPALRTYVDPPEERDRPPMLGVLFLAVFLGSVLALCGLAVYVWWPL